MCYICTYMYLFSLKSPSIEHVWCIQIYYTQQGSIKEKFNFCVLILYNSHWEWNVKILDLSEASILHISLYNGTVREHSHSWKCTGITKIKLFLFSIVREVWGALCWNTSEKCLSLKKDFNFTLEVNIYTGAITV